MKKHLIVSGIIIILLVVGLSGCSEISNPLAGNDDSRFVGTWKDEKSATITFFSDGEGSQGVMGFIWEIKDGKLVLEHGGDITIVYDYQFSNNDTSLTLTDVGIGTSRTYTKQ
jgi:hypothetical protein